MFTIHMSQVICIGLSRVNWGQPLIQLAKSRLVCGRDVVFLPAGRVHKHLKWFVADVANKEVVFEKSSTIQHCKPEKMLWLFGSCIIRWLLHFWGHCHFYDITVNLKTGDYINGKENILTSNNTSKFWYCCFFYLPAVFLNNGHSKRR